MQNERIEYLHNLLSKWMYHLNNIDRRDNIPRPKNVLLTKSEIVMLTKVSDPTFYRWCRSGDLKSTKPAGYRIWVEDLAKFLKSKDFYTAA